MYDLAKVPGILKACEAIALDNGAINRNRSSMDHAKEVGMWLDEVKDQFDLVMIDAWFSGLSEEDLDTACNGVDEAMVEICKTAPPNTDEFLNLYFNEVC
jgi:hypothetical protein